MKKDEFARRRRQLMKMLGKDTIAIVPAAPVRHRNSDVEYFYRQDSDFYYLTGFCEPEAVAVLMPGRPHGEYVLFVRAGVQLSYEDLAPFRERGPVPSSATH